MNKDNEFSQLFFLSSRKYYNPSRLARIKNRYKKPNKRKSPKLEPEEFIKHLVSLRQKAGITQQELALRLRTTQSFISYFENGRGNPTIKLLNRYSQAIGVKLGIQITQK